MGLKKRDFDREKNEGYFENLAKGTQQIIRDAILEATDLINNDNVWKTTEESIEEIECHSRDGFIAFDHNRGGLSFRNFSDLMGIWGSGYFPKAKASHDKIQAWVDDELQSATEAFFEKNQAKLEAIGIKNISEVSYHDLYERKEGSLAEELSEYENEFTSGELNSVMYELQFMYHGKDADGVHSASVCSALNTEAPYHRSGRCELAKEVEITWRNQTELKKKLKAALQKTAKEVF